MLWVKQFEDATQDVISACMMDSPIEFEDEADKENEQEVNAIQ